MFEISVFDNIIQSDSEAITEDTYLYKKKGKKQIKILSPKDQLT